MSNLFLGWRRPRRRDRLKQVERKARGQGLLFNARNHFGEGVFLAREGHALTIAPTGAGKGRNVIIPNLLTYRGPVIVIDPKGENYIVTARARREMGQDVYVIDPFQVVSEVSDQLNPLDVLQRADVDAEGESRAMVKLLTGGKKRDSADGFWEDAAASIVTAVIYYAARVAPPHQRSLSLVHSLIRGDFDSWAARITRTGADAPRLIRSELESYAAIDASQTRAGILSFAQRATDVLIDEPARRTLERSTFSLDDVKSGKPMTVYLVLPPSKLNSHGDLLRLWVGALLKVIMTRSSPPEARTLFLIDECAQLGAFDDYRVAMTLLRSYGLSVWAFFQDLSQIQSLYGDWQTIINNASVFQTFGLNTFQNAQDVSGLLGASPEALMRLPKNTQIVRAPDDYGVPTLQVLDRIDYLDDPVFFGRYDSNRLYK